MRKLEGNYNGEQGLKDLQIPWTIKWFWILAKLLSQSSQPAWFCLTAGSLVPHLFFWTQFKKVTHAKPFLQLFERSIVSPEPAQFYSPGERPFSQLHLHYLMPTRKAEFSWWLFQIFGFPKFRRQVKVKSNLLEVCSISKWLRKSLHKVIFFSPPLNIKIIS